MHATFLRAQTHILAKFCWIREIKVSMESVGHAVHVCVHNMTQANKLICILAIFLHARAHNSAKLHDIAEIKVSMESQDYFPRV